MRLYNRLSSLYFKYKRIMWLTGILSSLGVPLAGYGAYLLSFLKQKQSLMTDNPELANSETTVNLFSWLSGSTDTLSSAVKVLFIVAILFVMILIVFQILAFIGRGTELSGVDEESEQQERKRKSVEKDIDFDDYGE